MRKHTLVWLSIFTLLVAAFAYGQGSTLVTAKIPFAFSAGGKSLPAGQYDFLRDSNASVITVSGVKGANAMVPVITRMAAGIHTTPRDAHVVFDVVGDARTLSEVWVSNDDGYMLYVTKGQHKHQILDVGSK